DVDSGSVRVLTAELDRQCAPFGVNNRPVWDGGERWFVLEGAGNVHLYRYGSGDMEAVVAGDRWVTGFDARADTVVFTATTATTLPELFVLDGDKERCLTSFGATFTEHVDAVAPERFIAVSPDGTEVEAWVMRPAGLEPGRRYPTLVNIHGGPF